MVVSAVSISENAVLVLEAAVASDRGVLHRRERATQLGPERPRYVCESDPKGQSSPSYDHLVD